MEKIKIIKSFPSMTRAEWIDYNKRLFEVLFLTENKTGNLYSESKKVYLKINKKLKIKTF